MSNYHNHGGKSTLGLLNDQAIFDQCAIRRNNLMLLVDNTIDTTMVAQSEEIDKKIREVAQETKCEVFCDRCKSAYVGDLFSIDDI